MTAAKEHDSFDTVAQAAATPEQNQPWAELGLKPDEYQRIRDILGRRPSAAELAMYSVMWSEHCSYKSSKKHLRQFGEKATPEMNRHLLVGIGENAGVVDIGDGWAATFKVESHNHPSFIEPFHGAATGIGGVVRDILAMGARPVAVMDDVRVGAPEHPDTARIVQGAVAGSSNYSNGLGVPNIGGSIAFDASYQGNPLVNAFALGVMRHEDLHLANARGVGNKVVLFGGRTGADGIGGVSVLASETFDADGPGETPRSVVGHPLTEKLVIEASLEAFAANLVEGIQDLGGAGLSCATSELASAGDGGMEIHLDLVPLRPEDAPMRPEEILMSESQERMMAVVKPENLDAFMAVLAKWDVEGAVLGEVTDTGNLVIKWHDEVIVDVPPRTVAHDGPVYDRPYARPTWQDQLQADVPQFAAAETGAELAASLTEILTHPNLASARAAYEQYHSLVRGDTVMARPDAVGVLRVDAETGRGVAIATRVNDRFSKLDPETGGKHAVLAAYRAVAVAGAEPWAISDCLNFGSPEDPAAMWQFVTAIGGVADACAELEVPVTGGNVSLYNGTGAPGQVDSSINPTPLVAMLGVFDDVSRATPSGWQSGGLNLYVLGQTRAEFGGSLYAHIRNHLGGTPPELDFEAEKTLAQVMISASRDGLIDAAREIGEGGLGAALGLGALRYGVGARIVLDELCAKSGLTAAQALFSESQGRVLVAVPRSEEPRFIAMLQARNVEATRIGVTQDPADGVPALEVQDHFTLALDKIAQEWESVLPPFFA